MRPLIVVLAIGLAASVQAQRERTTLAKKPGTISVEPEAFTKGQLLTAKAKFVPKISCSGPLFRAGLALRVYDRQVGDNVVYDSDVKKNTAFLAEAAAPWDSKTPGGTEVQVTFEPIAVPNTAPTEIYLGYFQTCAVTKVVCCDANGMLIKSTSETGERMGGGTFKLECPGGNTARCLYKQF